MPDPGIARRYGVALFDAALKRDIVDQVDSDLAAVKRLLTENRSLRRFMLSPEVLTEHKVEMLQKALGDRVHKLVVNFLLLLIDKKRFDHIDEIADAVDKLVDAHHGLVRARVMTPVELPAEQQAKLQRSLAALTGKDVVIEPEIDPSLIGGVRVVLGDRMLDGSVSRALDRLHDELAQVSVI